MAITINGSGITSSEIADGTIVNADVNDVAASKLTGALPALDGSSLTGVSGGKVLQVVSAERRSHLSVAADNTTDWITLTITPTSTTSKIKLSVSGGVSSGNTNNFSMLLLHRGSTNLAYGDAVGTSVPCWIDIGCRSAEKLMYYQQRNFSGVYIDSPNTTSEITYKVKVRSKVNGTILVGRTFDLGDSNRTTTMGMLIAEEIGA